MTVAGWAQKKKKGRKRARKAAACHRGAARKTEVTAPKDTYRE